MNNATMLNNRREELGGLPLTFANLDQMRQLYQAHEGLVAGLVATVDHSRRGGDYSDASDRAVDVILNGLDAMDAHFVNIGVGGATGAHRWLTAANALVTAGEDIPDGYEEATR